MSALTTVDTDLACYEMDGGNEVVVSRWLGSRRKTESRKNTGEKPKKTNKIRGAKIPKVTFSPGARRRKSGASHECIGEDVEAHLDLGRLEGGDGANEGGGDAGHC